LLFGGDFSFMDSKYTFDYIDELAKVINKRSKEIIGAEVVFKYSTVDEYLHYI
jgi:hypothetical protein